MHFSRKIWLKLYKFFIKQVIQVRPDRTKKTNFLRERERQKFAPSTRMALSPAVSYYHVDTCCLPFSNNPRCLNKLLLLFGCCSCWQISLHPHANLFGDTGARRIGARMFCLNIVCDFTST